MAGGVVWGVIPDEVGRWPRRVRGASYLCIWGHHVGAGAEQGRGQRSDQIPAKGLAPTDLPREASWQKHTSHPGGFHRRLGDLRGHCGRTEGPGDRSTEYVPVPVGKSAALNRPRAHPGPELSVVALPFAPTPSPWARWSETNNLSPLTQ